MIELSLGCSEPPCAAPSPAKGRALAGDATQLACRLLLALRKDGAEGRDHAVETRIGEWQALGIAELEVDGLAHVGAQVLRRRQQLRGDIYGAEACAGTRNIARRPAGAGGYVKDVLV